jgi:mannose-6-phosphate isomerase-like protein (cupin superfamily)
MEVMPSFQTINLDDLSQRMTDAYQNVVITEINESCLRLVVNDGEEFAWHFHPTSDELFLVLEGELIIDMQDRASLTLTSHTIVTVPAGTIHRVRAQQRAVLVLFEQTQASTEFLA